MISNTEKGVKAFTTVSRSPDETMGFGRRLGALLATGTVLALIGELGCGKTVFIQGVAQGLDIPEKYYITSPTYTLVNEYPGRVTLYHVDLYRISDPDEYEGIGLYEMLDGEGVVAIEWANMLPEGMFGNHIAVEIKISGATSRDIIISARGQNELNLVERALIKAGEKL